MKTFKILFIIAFIGSLYASDIRGLYVGAARNISGNIKIAKQLGLNAFIIDIKTDSGEITCDLGNPSLKSNNFIKNIKPLLNNLKKQGIYTIARIVTFKDKARNDLLIKNRDGSIYHDKEHVSWLNPYNPKVWDYIIEVAELAATAGFDEIQFDYIRFPPFKSIEKTEIYNNLKQKGRIELINDFLDVIVPRLHKFGVKVSVDVFGCIIPESMGNDSRISSQNLGQDYAAIASRVDYICPMIYPSHWQSDSLGLKTPDLQPYGVVEKSLKCSKKILGKLSSKVRPWIQAFSATWLKPGTWQDYKRKQIDEQINAAKSVGVNSFSIWNSKCSYNHRVNN